MTREEAIKVIESSDLFWFRPTGEERVALDMAIEALSEPKTGKWAEIENGEYLCSNCLHITIGYPPSNCPNCGSFNGGEEE